MHVRMHAPDELDQRATPPIPDRWAGILLALIAGLFVLGVVLLPAPLTHQSWGAAPQLSAAAVSASEPARLELEPSAQVQKQGERSEQTSIHAEPGVRPLILTGIHVSSGQLEIGRPARIWLSATNLNSVPTARVLSLEARAGDGAPALSQTVEFNLEAGQTASRMVEWVPETTGPYLLRVLDDPSPGVQVEVVPKLGQPSPEHRTTRVAAASAPRSAEDGVVVSGLAANATEFVVDRPIEVEVVAENHASVDGSTSATVWAARWVEDRRFATVDRWLLGRVELSAPPGQSGREYLLWTPQSDGRYLLWIEHDPALRVGVEVREPQAEEANRATHTSVGQ